MKVKSMASDNKLTSDCGPHCGIDGFGEHKRVGHCAGCHNRTCEGSHYDRTETKRNG
jgi:hypothetical protein